MGREQDRGWLLREIEIAAKETEDWPEWMQEPRLWHPTLGRSAASPESNPGTGER